MLAPQLGMAQGSMPLSEYLERARDAGVNVIYSSSLVNPSQRIEVDSRLPFSLEQLRRSAAQWGLMVEEVAANSYLLRAASVPDQTQPAVAKLPRGEPAILEEVVVHSSRYRWHRQQGSTAILGAEELIKRPVLANDAMRVVNQLPGSASVGISARPRVRGGRENETLIEFDTVRLYNPFHFSDYNSLYSVFDERLLGEIEFFSGAFPLQYGDRLSASMSISPPDADSLKNQRELGLGLYQFSYLQSRVTSRDALLMSVRRSTPEAGHLLDSQDLGHPEFGDFFLRYERDTEAGGRWSGNILWYADDLSLGSDATGEEADSEFASGYAWLRLQSPLGASLERETTVGLAYLDNQRSGEVRQAAKVAGSLSNSLDARVFFANQDYRLLKSRGQLSFGWDYRYLEADYDYRSQQVVAPAFAGLSNIDRSIVEAYGDSQKAQQAALYLGWEQRLVEGLYVDASVRVDAQRYEDRSDTESGYRLGLLYELTSALDIRFAWGRYSQSMGLSELPVADLVWEIQAPQIANHAVLALDYELPVLDAGLRVEAYSKDADAVTAYFDSLSNPFTLLPELQPDRIRISPERYRARGLEVSVDVPFSWGEFWANFAYSSAKDRIDGQSVRRSWDQGRTVNLGIQTRLGQWDVALAGGFHEGWLTTPLELEAGRVVAGVRNSDSFDHYFSVDLKLIRRWSFAWGDLRLEGGLTNLLDRENAVGNDYRLDGNALRNTPFYGVPRTAFFDLYWSF
ncbi:MAG: hypothetical protein NWQ45_01540 [Congregibacter sp.]|nr:hypothetical protein [Congregibacter sp.]